MRSFLEIFRFELRLQRRSPLFLAFVALTFVVHFCTARKWGISIGLGAADTSTLALNAPAAIIQSELVLSLLAILSALALVGTAITRDQERGTAELFYTQPIKPAAYVWGRFGAATLLAVLVAMAGLFGSLISLLAPGIEPGRLAPMTASPWWFALVVVVVPNTLIVAALVYAAAASVRSIAGAFCAALILPVTPFIALSRYERGASDVLALIDPFGLVAYMDVTRFWTRRELLTQLPEGMLLANRAIWLSIAACVLVGVLARYRLSIAAPARWRRRQPTPAATVQPLRSMPRVSISATFGLRSALAQFASQWRVDLGAILRSPPFYLVVMLVAAACVSEFNTPSVVFNAPQAPSTGRLVQSLELGLILQITLAIIWYAGLLVHRDRQYRVAEIVDATPVATVIPVVSKIAALLTMVTLLLGGAILTFVLLQLASGYTAIEPGLYLAGTVRYGFNHYLLVVPAVLMSLLFANRWLGMLAFLAAWIAALSLGPLGFESLLVTFRLPPTPYSDMNGFVHYAVRDVSLMAYWAAFLALLAVLACLVAPRGFYDRVHQRFAAAGARVTQPVLAMTTVAGLLFAGLGGWIYYNTHVLNEYLTSATLQARTIDYERKFRRYEALWTPHAADVDLALDFFPEQRRLAARGTMRLANDSGAPITDFLVAFNPAVSVRSLALEGARLIESDPALGVRRYRFSPALPPGSQARASWQVSWQAKGFANSLPHNALAANGSWILAGDILPTFGYDSEREIEDPFERRRQGLLPNRRMPSLDDRAARNRPGDWAQVPANVRAVVSTSAGQVPVSPGRLRREWTDGGRRYALYEGHMPVDLAFASARYQVKRERALDGTIVEAYFDPRHEVAVPMGMDTAKRGLSYYSRQFGPYPRAFGSYRIIEYPTYWKSVHSFPGGTAYNEAAGFSLLFQRGTVDIAMAHELAHVWWGGQLRSAAVQGQEVLTEALASYSAYMLIEHEHGQAAVRPYLQFTRDIYLDAVSREVTEPLPVIRAESAANTYHKGSLVMYTLRDAIGAEPVNRALRSFLAKYGNRPPPNPTTRELVTELRAVAGDRYQPLITDLFERVTFYDVSLRSAQNRRSGKGYEVTILVDAQKRYTDQRGTETAAPLYAPFDIAVFSETGDKPLHLAKHWLRTGTQRIVVRVEALPARVAVDPYGMMIDRKGDDNELEI